MQQLHSNIEIMEDEHICNSPSNLYQPIFKSISEFSSWFTNTSVRSVTPKVRHNFKSIDELLSSSPSPKHGKYLNLF